MFKSINKKVSSSSVIYYRDVENSDPIKYLDGICYKTHQIAEDSIENHIIYDPIPKEVKESLRPEYREILDIILFFREFPLEYYSKLKHISKDAARKRNYKMDLF